MTEKDVKFLIRDEIRAHEYRVGFVSGILGGVILASLYSWLYILTFR